MRNSMLQAGKEVFRKGLTLAPKLAPALAGKATEFYINKRVNELNKKFTSIRNNSNKQ